MDGVCKHFFLNSFAVDSACSPVQGRQRNTFLLMHVDASRGLTVEERIRLT